MLNRTNADKTINETMAYMKGEKTNELNGISTQQEKEESSTWYDNKLSTIKIINASSSVEPFPDFMNEKNFKILINADDKNPGQRQRRFDVDKVTLYDVIGKMNREGVNDPKYRAEEIFLMSDASDNKITQKEFIFACKDEPVLCRLRIQDV
ncbi:unnamed protein product [Adineta steineri]|uniref:Uncharacterized protein n=1 Tax=Adineta steineri TaxID=433720 RepID=A0A818KH83_9BILA|nr:unnamed protein product [Adineta steineri]